MIKTVILAGGLGLRLRPVVADRPKPLAEINGEPFLELQLRVLRRAGVRDVVLCVGHRADQIVAALGDGAALGLTLEYAVEQQPLGTAGALKNAAATLRGERRFLLLNGDTFVDVDLAQLVARDAARGDLGTLCVWRAPDARGKGVVEIDGEERVSGFAEKAGSGPAWVNAGVYAFDARLLERIPGGRTVSLEHEIIPAALRAGERIHVQRVDGRLIDIGTPEDYARAQTMLEDLSAAAAGERGADRGRRR